MNFKNLVKFLNFTHFTMVSHKFSIYEYIHDQVTDSDAYVYKVIFVGARAIVT